VKAELLIHLAANDDRKRDLPHYKAARDRAREVRGLHGPRHRARLSQRHPPPRFDAAAAKLAWTRTLVLFGRKLRNHA